jgi:IclR family acetate operon transcriptional repressor
MLSTMWKAILKSKGLLSMKARPLTVKKPSGAMSGKGESRETVQSLSRALGLLKALAAHDEGLGLSEVAKQVGLAVSTTHRLLTTLQQESFVRFDEQRGVWTVGVQAYVVGSAFLRARDLTAIARPIMRRLMEEQGETVNLAVEDSGEAIYVAQVESRQMMRAIARPGGRAMMHASGVGKALLAAMASPDFERIIAENGLPAETDKTLRTPATLRAELDAIRRRGFAIDDEENAVGLRCVAAPIYDEDGQPIAAISLSGPKARITDAMIDTLGRAIRDAARTITAALGGQQGASSSY